MARLTEPQVLTLRAEIMSAWSAGHTETPITKAQLKALLENIDAGLESAETSIISGLTNGAAKTWLVAHQSIGRRVLEEVAQERRKVL